MEGPISKGEEFPRLGLRVVRVQYVVWMSSESDFEHVFVLALSGNR